MATQAPPPSAFRQTLKGMAVQRDVIGALMLREVHTRYGRQNIGYAWLLIDPLILAVSVALIHLATGGHQRTTINPAAFSMVGYIVFIMFRSIFGRSGSAIESNASLLHHRRVRVPDIVIARALLDLVATVAAYIVLIGIAIAAGWATLPARPQYVALAIFAMFLFSTGAGMLLCAGAHDRPMVERFSHPLTYLSMPISGAFYMVDWFTPKVQAWLELIPLVNLFEMLRYGQFEVVSDDHFHIAYLMLWCLVLIVLGLLALRAVEPHIHVD